MKRWTDEEIQQLLAVATAGTWTNMNGLIWSGEQPLYQFWDRSEDLFANAENNAALLCAAPDIIQQLLQQKQELDRSNDQLLQERDEAIEAADNLSYALFTDEQIGEHTNCNNPWEKALEQLQPLDRVLHLVSVPKGLDELTAKLVVDFATAVAAKLKHAQDKYGFQRHWSSDDWADLCRQELLEHVFKGDPRDVAAYAAFCWHHQWPTGDKDHPAVHLELAARRIIWGSHGFMFNEIKHPGFGQPFAEEFNTACDVLTKLHRQAYDFLLKVSGSTPEFPPFTATAEEDANWLTDLVKKLGGEING